MELKNLSVGEQKYLSSSIQSLSALKTGLHTFTPDVGTFPPRMPMPSTARFWLNRLRTSVERFCSCLDKWGMAPSVECVWHRRTDCRPCCPPMSCPLPFP